MCGGCSAANLDHQFKFIHGDFSKFILMIMYVIEKDAHFQRMSQNSIKIANYFDLSELAV